MTRRELIQALRDHGDLDDVVLTGTAGGDVGFDVLRVEERMALPARGRERRVALLVMGRQAVQVRRR